MAQRLYRVLSVGWDHAVQDGCQLEPGVAVSWQQGMQSDRVDAGDACSDGYKVGMMVGLVAVAVGCQVGGASLGAGLSRE